MGDNGDIGLCLHLPDVTYNVKYSTVSNCFTAPDILVYVVPTEEELEIVALLVFQFSA